MLDRAAIGVLGVLLAGLALAALAVQSREHRAAPPIARPAEAQAPRAPAPSAAALRALRDGERIDVNRARPEDLELLPGIGPKLARRIVEHRAAHGPFQGERDLLQVRGIGERTLARLAPLLAFGAGAGGGSSPEPNHSSNMNRTAADTAK